jgi:hypothetical protein
MRARETLEHLCRRHGVSEDFGRRLLPLLERAAAAPPDVRARLVGLVEQSLEREGQRQTELRRSRAARDEQALVNVARALHVWEPPDDFDPERHAPEDLDPGGLGPDGFDLAD